MSDRLRNSGYGPKTERRTCPYCGGLVAVTPAHKQLRRHLSSGEFCRGSGLSADALSVQNAQPPQTLGEARDPRWLEP